IVNIGGNLSTAHRTRRTAASSTVMFLPKRSTASRQALSLLITRQSKGATKGVSTPPIASPCRCHPDGQPLARPLLSAAPVPRGTNGAEEIGVFVPLVGRLAWSPSTPGPLLDAAILLADARLVLT